MTTAVYDPTTEAILRKTEELHALRAMFQRIGAGDRTQVQVALERAIELMRSLITLLEQPSAMTWPSRDEVLALARESKRDLERKLCDVVAIIARSRDVT